MQHLADTTNAAQPERSNGGAKRVTRSMSKRGSSSSSASEDENPGVATNEAAAADAPMSSTKGESAEGSGAGSPSGRPSIETDRSSPNPSPYHAPCASPRASPGKGKRMKRIRERSGVY